MWSFVIISSYILLALWRVINLPSCFRLPNWYIWVTVVIIPSFKTTVIIIAVTGIRIPFSSLSWADNPSVSIPVGLIVPVVIIPFKATTIGIIVVIPLRLSYVVVPSFNPVPAVGGVVIPSVKRTIISLSIIIVPPEPGIAIIPVVAFKAAGSIAAVIVLANPWAINTHFVIPELGTTRAV